LEQADSGAWINRPKTAQLSGDKAVAVVHLEQWTLRTASDVDQAAAGLQANRCI